MYGKSCLYHHVKAEECNNPDKYSLELEVEKWGKFQKRKNKLLWSSWENW